MRTFIIALLLSAVAVAAEVVSFDFNESTTFHGVVPTVVLDPQETGKIVAIELCLRHVYRNDVGVENTDASDATATVSFTGAGFIAKLGKQILFTHNYMDRSRVFDLAASDGMLDFDGPSGEHVTFTQQGGLGAVLITDPALIGALLSGSTPIEIIGQDFFASSGPGNLVVGSHSTLRVMGLVLVHRRPVPQP